MTMRHLPLLRERQKSFSTDWLCKIFLGPVVTEKAYKHADQKIYTIKVHPEATKVSIATAFKKMFDITPASINVLVLKGKQKRRKSGNKEIQVKRPNVKKAMIRIPEGVDFDLTNMG